MPLHYLVLSLIITLFCTSTTLAKDLMDPVIVTAKKVEVKDTKATYASEVYYRKDIEKSDARTVIDFLNQNICQMYYINCIYSLKKKIIIKII